MDAMTLELEGRGVQVAQCDSVQSLDAATTPATSGARMWVGKLSRGGGLLLVRPYEWACLVVLLAVVSTLPVLQLIAFGYLLDIGGRIYRSGRLSYGLPMLREATRIVTAALALWLFSLPVRLLGNWATSAQLIAADSAQVSNLMLAARIVAGVVLVYLMWAWSRGGRIRDYLWPAPLRFLKQGWRPSYWRAAVDRLWSMVVRLELPRLFWLGLRGLVGTLVWIGIPALMLIGASRRGESGLAGLVGIVGALSMGVVLMYLPFLQARMAAENRFRAIFQMREVRAMFRRSPLAFWLGLSLTLLLAVPPYLLKIEALPREIVWLPAAVVIAFVIPGRMLVGWAMARATRRPEPTGKLRWAWRSVIRLAIPPVVGGYLLVVYLTQYTSWHGLATWFQQHAIGIPAPFTGT